MIEILQSVYDTQYYMLPICRLLTIDSHCESVYGGCLNLAEKMISVLSAADMHEKYLQ